MSRPDLYLDYNATGPLRTEVLDEMLPSLRQSYGNPSSAHSFGREAAGLIDLSRHRLATLLGSSLDEIIFTSGGTEANNMALAGVMRAASSAGKNHLITTAVEHSSVFIMAERLESEGCTVTYLPVDAAGRLDPQLLRAAIRRETGLISIQYANNEIGTLQDMESISRLARLARIPLHTDAVQAIGKVEVNVDALGASLLSLSGHKFGGPKGTGALFLRRGTRLQPAVIGGRQEAGRRAGTENVPGIVGLGKAAEMVAQLCSDEMAAMESIRRDLMESLACHFPGARFNGHAVYRTPNTLSVTLPGVAADSLVTRLDLQGVAVSTGSACSAGTNAGSKVLAAIGLSLSDQKSTLRLSLGPATTPEETEEFIRILRDILP